MMTDAYDVNLNWLLALALPPLAVLLVLLWAAHLRQRGRFEGGVGRLHGLGRHFESARSSELARDLSALGSSTLVTLLGALLCGAFVLAGDVRAAVLLASLGLLAGGLGTLLKRRTARLRPGAAGSLHFGSSFPSSHTLMGSSLYGGAAVLHAAGTPDSLLALPGLVAALLLSFLIGASRVLLRVHYVSDVVAGWLLAAALIISVGLLHQPSP